jgi:hypothetical protein
MLGPMAFLVFGAIVALANQIRTDACYPHEFDFKYDPLERGLSIDEIEFVVAAKWQ